ncbi:MAG TPA: hypothetical protein VGL20_19675 [Candidatus Dormibacteraeota bacterium]
MLDDCTRDTFEPHVGTSFRVTPAPSAPVELELVRVSDVGGGDGGRSFALLFRGPLGAALGQGVVELEHEQLGAVALFIVPVAADAAGMQYEAVFNRLPLRP